VLDHSLLSETLLNKYCTSRIVDGETDSVSIAKLFANSYRDLYTSVPYDRDKRMLINDESIL
jgi:hypothetical protein